MDRSLLTSFLILTICGIMMVATASPPVAETIGLPPYHFLMRHIVMLFPAMALLIGISLLSHKVIWRASTIVFVLAMIGMLIVPFIGAEIKGAQRWLRIFGFSLQPSEFIKPAFLIISAYFISRKKTGENTAGYYVAFGLYLAVITLLLMQPDLGMTFIVTASWIAQIFLAGFPLRYVTGIAAAGLGGLTTAYFAFDHVHSRINRFINPESGDNYQVDKSLEAIQNGGFFGAGPGQGTIKNHLPDAHADFIFSVGAEEMGLMFMATIIGIFAFIVLRGFKTLMDREDMFVILAAGSLLAMFGLQAIVHMGSALNVLPAKGMTLPFISYGGSSILAIGYAMGVVLGLTRKQTRIAMPKPRLVSKFGSFLYTPKQKNA